jgi:hypothetical protein
VIEKPFSAETFLLQRGDHLMGKDKDVKKETKKKPSKSLKEKKEAKKIRKSEKMAL